MTLTLLIFYIIADTAALTWGYRTANYTAVTPWCLLFGTLWLVATWRKMEWVAMVGLLASVAVAGLGVLLGVSPGWMLAGTVFGLIAWDLSRFRKRLSLEYFEADLEGMERRHLLRISLLCVLVLGLTSIVFFSQLKFSLEWMILFTFAAFVAVQQFLRWYRSAK